jgi:4-carboxymuconolactone decarboxylase
VGDLPGVLRRCSVEEPGVGEADDIPAARRHESGPLGRRERRLARLGVATGAESEGAVRSHARRALGEGIAGEEIRLVAVLAVTTAGFPAAGAAYGRINEVPDREP